MKGKQIVTVDTESDCDLKWRRSKPLTFHSITEGIPRFLRPLWDKYGIKPIYFVSPEVLRHEDSCTVLRKEIKKGAQIGTHLHSEYMDKGFTLKSIEGKFSGDFPCFRDSTEEEYRKIKNLTELIRKKLGFRPIWYRAARYGADIDTIKILKRLGYKYDSSVTPGIDWRRQGGPDFTSAPNQPYWISKTDLSKPANKSDSIGIMEYPATISGKRFGVLGSLLPDRWIFLRWLRPSHVTWPELRSIYNEFQELENPVYTLMFHTMELLPGKTPFVRNRLMQKLFIKRVEKAVSYIQ